MDFDGKQRKPEEGNLVSRSPARHGRDDAPDVLDGAPHVLAVGALLSEFRLGGQLDWEGLRVGDVPVEHVHLVAGHGARRW
jgi:hypothetical protein